MLAPVCPKRSSLDIYCILVEYVYTFVDMQAGNATFAAAAAAVPPLPKPAIAAEAASRRAFIARGERSIDATYAQNAPFYSKPQGPKQTVACVPRFSRIVTPVSR